MINDSENKEVPEAGHVGIVKDNGLFHCVNYDIPPQFNAAIMPGGIGMKDDGVPGIESQG
jgi:hypothetical protein